MTPIARQVEEKELESINRGAYGQWTAAIWPRMLSSQHSTGVEARIETTRTQNGTTLHRHSISLSS